MDGIKVYNYILHLSTNEDTSLYLFQPFFKLPDVLIEKLPVLHSVNNPYVNGVTLREQNLS